MEASSNSRQGGENHQWFSRIIAARLRAWLREKR